MINKGIISPIGLPKLTSYLKYYIRRSDLLNIYQQFVSNCDKVGMMWVSEFFDHTPQGRLSIMYFEFISPENYIMPNEQKLLHGTIGLFDLFYLLLAAL